MLINIIEKLLQNKHVPKVQISSPRCTCSFMYMYKRQFLLLRQRLIHVRNSDHHAIKNLIRPAACLSTSIIRIDSTLHLCTGPAGLTAYDTAASIAPGPLSCC